MFSVMPCDCVFHWNYFLLLWKQYSIKKIFEKGKSHGAGTQETLNHLDYGL